MTKTPKTLTDAVLEIVQPPIHTSPPKPRVQIFPGKGTTSKCLKSVWRSFNHGRTEKISLRAFALLPENRKWDIAIEWLKSKGLLKSLR